MRCAVLIVLGLLGSMPANAQILAAGQPAIELDIAVDSNNKPFKLAAFRGRWIVLSIGAAWCGPCRDELPVWNKLAGEVKGRATFISLALDNDIPDGKRFHQQLGVPNLVRAYLPEQSSNMIDRYGAASMPTTFVIDPRGVVRHVHLGFDKNRARREYEQLAAALAKLLPKPKPPPPKPGEPEPVTPVMVPRPLPLPPLVFPDHPHTMLWADHWQAPAF